MNKFKNLLFAFSIAATLTACDFMRASSDDAKVAISFPKNDSSQKLITKKVTTLSTTTTKWGLGTPETSSSVDCYVVYISAKDLESGICKDIDGNVVNQTSRLYGMYPAGSIATIEVPSGSDRTIGVFAVDSATGSCSGAFATEFNTENFSAPLNVGAVKTDLKSGENKVVIPISLTGAKAIESCSSGNFAKGTWPSCDLSIAGISYSGGGFDIAGSCLDQVTSASIKSSKGDIFNLALQAGTSSKVFGKMLNNFSFLTDRTYNLVVNTAYASAASPISLSFGENSYKVLSSGNYVGEMGKPSLSGAMINTVITGNDSAFGYYYDSTLATAYRTNDIYLKNANVSTIPLRDLVLDEQISSSGSIYFTGPDCSGDPLVSAYDSSSTVIGKNFALATGCEGDYDGPCTGVQFKELVGSGSYVSGYSVQSYLSPFYSYGTAASHFMNCQNYTTTASGFLYSGVQTSSTPIPAVLTNITFSK